MIVELQVIEFESARKAPFMHRIKMDTQSLVEWKSGKKWSAGIKNNWEIFDIYNE